MRYPTFFLNVLDNWYLNIFTMILHLKLDIKFSKSKMKCPPKQEFKRKIGTRCVVRGNKLLLVSVTLFQSAGLSSGCFALPHASGMVTE